MSRQRLGASLNQARLLLVLVAVLGALCASCGPGPEPAAKPVTVLRFWNGFTGPGTKYIERLVKEYNQQNEGQVRVEMSVMMWGDFYVKAPLALKGGKPPDIGAMHVPQMRDFAENGLLKPLDSCLAQFDSSDFYQNAWSVGQVKGARYALPLDVHPLVLYWNKQIFRKFGLDPNSPPRTRDEFLSIARRLSADGMRGILIPPNWPTHLVYYSVVGSNGASLFSADSKKCLTDSPEALDAAQFVQSLIEPEGFSPRNVEVDADSEAFRSGKAAMLINGIWMMPQFEDTPGLDFGMSILPNLGSRQHKVWAGSHQMVVFHHSRMDAQRAQASVKFLKFLSDNSVEWAKVGTIPVRRSFYESGAMEAVPLVSALQKDIDAIEFPLLSVEEEAAMGQVTEALFRSLRTGENVDSAMRESTQKASRLLEQERD